MQRKDMEMPLTFHGQRVDIYLGGSASELGIGDRNVYTSPF